MTMADTGLFIRAKVKRVSRKQSTDKEGKGYEKVSIHLAYDAGGLGEADDTEKVWMTTPPRHPLPELEEGKFYTFPVTISAGSDGLFMRLRTNAEIQPDEAA